MGTQKEQDLTTPKDVNSTSQPVERPSRQLNVHKVPKRQAGRPYASKPTPTKAATRTTDMQKRAVVLEPDEKRALTLQQMYTKDKVARRDKEQEIRRQEQRKAAEDETKKGENRKVTLFHRESTEVARGETKEAENRKATLFHRESTEVAYTSRRGTIVGRLVNYDLPPVIRSIAQGWKETISLMGIISVVCAVVQVALVHLSANVLFDPSNAALTNALRWFIYTSLLHLGTATSAALSITMLSDLPSYARETAIQDPESLSAKTLSGGDVAKSLSGGTSDTILLRKFGLGRTWESTRSHVMICFTMGCFCSFVTIGLWVWSLEVLRVSIAVVVPLALIVLPPFLVFLHLFIGK